MNNTFADYLKTYKIKYAGGDGAKGQPILDYLGAIDKQMERVGIYTDPDGGDGTYTVRSADGYEPGDFTTNYQAKRHGRTIASRVHYRDLSQYENEADKAIVPLRQKKVAVLQEAVDSYESETNTQVTHAERVRLGIAETGKAQWR